jgi:hypothetical protein
MIRYQVNIIEHDADLTAIRNVCADLLLPDQLNDANEEVNAVYVDSSNVGEAVSRINALGYRTDEDENNEELVENVDYLTDDFGKE